MVDGDVLVGVLHADGFSKAADDVALLLEASKRISKTVAGPKTSEVLM